MGIGTSSQVPPFWRAHISSITACLFSWWGDASPGDLGINKRQRRHTNIMQRGKTDSTSQCDEEMGFE